MCDLIMQRLQDQCVTMIAQDSFYRSLTREEMAQAASGEYNFGKLTHVLTLRLPQRVSDGQGKVRGATL